jgi:ribosomal-protein-alanine N-acetyltransferase
MKRDLALASHGPMQRTLTDMRIENLDAVMAIESAAYAVPWTRGNFIDSLASSCTALCLFDARPSMIGYLVAMRGAGEVHLLNLTVAPLARRQGHACHMLEHLVSTANDGVTEQVWLEVRASNAPALALYRRFGFAEVGLRKGYYPAPSGGASSVREDAVAMSLALARGRP